MNPEDFEPRFKGVDWNDPHHDAFKFSCPAPEHGANPRKALCSRDPHDGRIIFTCPAGCTQDRIIAFSNGNLSENSAHGTPPQSSPRAATAPPAAAGPHQTPPLHVSSPPSDDILRRVPPQDVEAEQAVLGAILIDNQAIKKIEFLAVDDFYREAHKEIYRCMLTLSGDETPIDPVTLIDALRTRDKVEAIGGLAYITELAAAVPSPSAIAHYARIVNDKAKLRTLASAASEIQTAAYDNPDDVQTLLALAQKRFNAPALIEAKGAPAMRGRSIIKMQTAAQYLFEQGVRAARKAFLGGLVYSGDVAGVLGRPMTGKSTLACALVKALIRGYPTFLNRPCAKARVGYFALERNGSKVAALFEKWGIADEVVFTDFVAPTKPDELVAALEYVIREHKLDVIIIDHAQSLLRIADTNAYGQVSLALEPINRVARETGVAVILLHHQPKPQQAGKGATTPDGDGQINAMGSEAWRGALDVLIETTKSGAKRYSIRADVRGGDGLPRTLVKIDEAGEAVARDVAEVEAQEAAEAVKKYLATQSEPRDYAEIQDAVAMKRSPVVTACRVGYEAGIYGREGKGKSGDPFKYFLKAEKSVPDPSRRYGNRPVNGQSNDAANEGGVVERILDGKRTLFPPLDIGTGTAGTANQSSLRAVEESQFPASREQTLKNGSSGTGSESQNGALMSVAGTAGTTGTAGTGAEGDPAEYQDGSDRSALADSDESPEPNIEFSEEKF